MSVSAMNMGRLKTRGCVLRPSVRGPASSSLLLAASCAAVGAGVAAGPLAVCRGVCISPGDTGINTLPAAVTVGESWGPAAAPAAPAAAGALGGATPTAVLLAARFGTPCFSCKSATASQSEDRASAACAELPLPPAAVLRPAGLLFILLLELYAGLMLRQLSCGSAVTMPGVGKGGFLLVFSQGV